MLWLENWLFWHCTSKSEVWKEMCWCASNVFLHLSAVFLSLFSYFSCALCLVWALAKHRMKPHDVHAAFSTLRYLYLPREAFLYGVEIKTAHATYWVMSLLVGVEDCQTALVCLQTGLVGQWRSTETRENVFLHPLLSLCVGRVH